MMTSADKNKLNLEMQELRDHIDIKDRKINVLQRKVGRGCLVGQSLEHGRLPSAGLVSIETD